MSPSTKYEYKLSLPGFRTGNKYTAINILIDCNICPFFLLFLLMCLYYYYYFCALLIEAARILALKTCKFDQFRQNIFLLKRETAPSQIHTAQVRALEK